MLHRRQFLKSTLKGSTLIAAGVAVPEFLARAAQAATPAKDDTVLVVLEMAGGNDGLNMVIPYADDLYHKARPTLGRTKGQVLVVNDHIGLHDGLRSLQTMLHNKQVAIVQGVGYPNPDRSHFESMDIWHLADPKRQQPTGWLARATPHLLDNKGGVPAVQIGAEKLPLALQGSAGGAVSLNNKVPYKLDLGTDPGRAKARRKLLEDLGRMPAGNGGADDLLAFVRRRQVQTYATLDKLQKALTDERLNNQPNALMTKLSLIARMVKQGFRTRIYFLSIDGFDNHSTEEQQYATLMRTIGDAVNQFFTQLGSEAQRVCLMTFSEFGRRVHENGSRGTDHGAASCLFVIGPAVAGGPVGKHPRLDDLDAGDLKFHTDFRQVYATVLDQWLGCDSKTVLGGAFAPVPLFAKAEAARKG